MQESQPQQVTQQPGRMAGSARAAMSPNRYNVVIRLLLLCSLFLAAGGAGAAKLEIPLRVPLEALREALAAQLAGPKEKPRELYRQGPCRFLNLEPPKLEAVDGQLKLAAPGAAALGIELGGQCRTPAAWQGVVHFTLAPELDGDGRLRMRIVDSRLDGTDGKRAPTVGVVWDLAKQQLHPRLERFTYDLGASRGAMMSVLREAAPEPQRAAMEDAVNQMQVQPPRVEAAHVLVQIAMEVPDAWLAAPAGAQAAAPAAAATAPLSEDEIEALEKAMAPWDAFLVNSIKQVARESDDGALRRKLFDLLLASRYRLTEILADGTAPGVDPVRTLFLDSWRELGATLREAQRDGLLKTSALRYAVFVDAGDALLSLERAAPGLGMRMTPEGLRQLARSLRPDSKADPLEYDWAEDQDLRSLFFAQAMPVLPGGPQKPPPGKPAPDQNSSLGGFIRVAAAQPKEPLSGLDKWVPGKEELGDYEQKVSALLKDVAATEGKRAALAAPYDRMFMDLVPTTALIESCWRQFIVKNGKVSYLKSSAGSVGIMQINQHVWRGFYDISKVRWDPAYNARAGAEILLRYMKDYAIPYAQKNGDPNLAPRAVYAVYNAGPKAVGRFAKQTPHPREKRVDDKLLALYKGIASGGQADLKSCGVK